MKIKNILGIIGISLLGTGVSGGVNSIVNELRNDFKIVYDVSKCSIDVLPLVEITKEFESGKYFLWQMQPQLEEEVFNQLNTEENFWLSSTEVEIIWNTELTSIVETNDVIDFTIASRPENFDVYNDLNVTFQSSSTQNLQNVNLNCEKLAEITKEFESGIYFREMKESLNQEIYYQLENQEINSNYISINWNVDDEDLIYPNQELKFNLTSNDNSIIGNNGGSFFSSQFSNLEKFNLNSEKLAQISQDYKNESFSKAIPELENEIYSQLEYQNFNIDYIKIYWEIDDKEKKLEEGEKVNFLLYSLNTTIVINEFNSYFYWISIPPDIVDPTPNPSPNEDLSLLPFWIVLIILIIILFLIISYTLFKVRRNKIEQKTREKNGELTIDLSKISELQEEEE